MIVILNADDLGFSREVNSEIFEMLSVKRVTSATVMANAPYLDDAAREIRYFSDCSFGVHLNITVFRPLLLNNTLKILLDQDGFFTGNIEDTRITPKLFYAIYKEFCAQIEKLYYLGIKVSHIDSHNHIHNLPKIFPILKRVQIKYGIRKVRISKNIYTHDDELSKSLLLQKKVYNFMLRTMFKTKTTDGFTDLMTFNTNGYRNKLGYRTIELVVHPGAKGYEKERELLNSSWQERLPFPVKLISYHQL